MKYWTFSVKNKWRAAFASTAIIVVMLTLSMLGKWNVEDFRSSLQSVYEDRLVAEQHIFHMSTLIYENKLNLRELNEDDSSSDILSETLDNSEALAELSEKYSHTTFTEEEKKLFESLTVLFSEINKTEREMILHLGDSAKRDVMINSLTIYYTEAITHLHELSDLQLDVAEGILEKSNNLADSSVVLSRVEITILITVALFVLIVIYSARLGTPRKVDKNQEPNTKN